MARGLAPSQRLPPTALQVGAAAAGLALAGIGAAALAGLGLPLAQPAAVACAAVGFGLAFAGRRALHASPPPGLLAASGAALLLGVILAGALAGAGFDARWLALAALGVALQVAAPLARRPVAPGRRLPLAGLVAASALLAGAPLVAWGLLAVV